MWIGDNLLTTLPAGLFAGLSSLESLVPFRNNMAALPEGLFEDLGSLRDMWIDSNALSALPEKTFDGLSSLESLSMGYNPLGALPERIFAGLSRLSRLHVPQAGLTELPPRVFRDLAALETLGLSLNGLRELPPGIFAGLAALENLWLSLNGLRELPPGIFADLASLASLSLAGNRLTALPAGVFSGLPGFQSLEFHENPGAPFTLTLQLVRTDRTASGGAVAVRVAEGAPFDIEMPVSAAGGRLSASRIAIGAGRIVGDSIAVSTQASTAVVRLGLPSAIPRGSGCGIESGCIRGLRPVAGAPIGISAPAPFTDQPLRPGVTPVKAVHFQELRQRTGGLREGAGLPAFRWTDPILRPGVTPVRQEHLAELRQALAEVYAAAERPPPVYSDAALPEGTVAGPRTSWSCEWRSGRSSDGIAPCNRRTDTTGSVRELADSW